MPLDKKKKDANMVNPFYWADKKKKKEFFRITMSYLTITHSPENRLDYKNGASV